MWNIQFFYRLMRMFCSTGYLQFICKEQFWNIHTPQLGEQHCWWIKSRRNNIKQLTVTSYLSTIFHKFSSLNSSAIILVVPWSIDENKTNNDEIWQLSKKLNIIGWQCWVELKTMNRHEILIFAQYWNATWNINRKYRSYFWIPH